MSRYFGVDIHRNCFMVCTQLENGRQYISTQKLERLPQFVSRLRSDDEVAVEVTGNTRLFYDAVAPQVSRVVIVNPFQFEVIRRSVKKMDQHDARALPLFLSKDMLPEVRMKDQEHAEMASLTQPRDSLVKSRTALKNKVNNLLSARGVNLNKESLASEKGLDHVFGMCFGSTVDVKLQVLVEQIRSLNKSIAKLEQEISKQTPKLPGYDNLKSIKGIGDVGAGVLLSVIGDVNDFADEGKLAAYFGIVPRVSNSNDTERSGRITKRGSKMGRTVLVQCAMIAKRYSSYLSTYYECIKMRCGTGKAIIALARKFLGIIYRTLKDNIIWEDVPNGVIRETEGCT